MDKSKLQSGLFDLLRDHLPKFDRTARVTCLLSVRLDGSDESSVFLEIAENIPAQPVLPVAPVDIAATAAKATPEKSKRKSQAPQKIVTNGEDSFVSEAAVTILPSLVSGCEASSSSSLNISADLSAAAAVAEQAVNLTVSSRSSSFLPPPQPSHVSATTPIKDATSAGRLGLGFFVNNTGFAQQHFLLQQGAGILAAGVFPTPTTVFQTAILPQPVPPPVATTPPRPALTEEKAASTPINEDANGVGVVLEVSPKLPIMPANSSATQRSRSLFGLRSRRGGHKSFPCNQCHESFNSLAALSKHTYSNHKGYKCTFCSANFTQRSNLQRHSLKHVGFKPFACRCCQKSYYRKDHLVRHIEVTHPGKEPKKNIETKLSSAECLEYLERKYESGEYSITLDADVDEEMAEGEAAEVKARTEGDEDMPDAEDEEDEEEAEEEEEEGDGGAVAEEVVAAQTVEKEEQVEKLPQSDPQQQTQPQSQPQRQLRRGLRRQPRRQDVTSESNAGMRLQIELPSNSSS